MNMKSILKFALLLHERFWRKLRRRMRRYYYRIVLGGMGRDCQICDDVLITDPEHTFLGSRVRLNEGVKLLTFNSDSQLIIGDDVTISYDVCLLTGGLDLSNGVDHNNHIFSPIVIENGVWIGAKAVISAGVRVGEGAVVSAGSFVNKDVAPNTVVAGSPAKVIKTLELQD